MIVTAMKFIYGSGERPLEGYTIKRGIGVGGFGEVYYAVSDAGKEVALKLVQRSLEVELRGVNQCLNLKHPHLVSLYDVKQSDDGQTWVVMEYMAGESLEQILERHPHGLGAGEAVRWMRGIADAVDYLHDHGVVHRDLKPANLFVEDGLIKVGDYGLAKFVSVSRRSGHTESVGTVHYMAPEVANGRYGKELDVYAAGIIFYEMLTGRVPFDGQSVGEILMKHLTSEPDLRGLEEPYRRVVARALAKDPADRYATLGEMLDDLRTAGVPLAGGREAGFHRLENGRHRGGRAVAASMPSAESGAEVVSKSVFEEVWTDFFREDPIMRLIRGTWNLVWPKLEASAMLLILATVLATILTLSGALPALATCVISYIAIALPLRWLSRLWWSPRTAPPPEAAPPQPPNLEGVPPVGSADTRAAPGPAVQPVVVSRRARRRQNALLHPVAKSLRRHTTELTSSLLVATVLASLCAVGLATILGFERPEEVALLGLVGTVGSWAVLIPAKGWEGAAGDAVMRRLVMMGLGAAVGLFAAVASRYLLVSLPDSPLLDVRVTRSARWHTPVPHLYDPAGEPFPRAYAMFYASLFLVPRWWRQADPYRKSRFGFVPLFIVAFWAWAASVFWEFSDPWAVASGVLISAVVQLASPWHPEEMRPAEAKEVVA